MIDRNLFSPKQNVWNFLNLDEWNDLTRGRKEAGKKEEEGGGSRQKLFPRISGIAVGNFLIYIKLHTIWQHLNPSSGKRFLKVSHLKTSPNYGLLSLIFWSLPSKWTLSKRVETERCSCRQKHGELEEWGGERSRHKRKALKFLNSISGQLFNVIWSGRLTKQKIILKIVDVVVKY